MVFHTLHFPTLGINTGVTNLMYMVEKFIKVKFPPDFFKVTRVDSMNEIKRFREEFDKHTPDTGIKEETYQRPSLFVGFQLEDFNAEELTSHKNRYFNPGQDLKPGLRNCATVLRGPTGLSIMTIDSPLRIKFTIDIEVPTRSDQISVVSILKNSLRFVYGYDFSNVKTSYFLNSELMTMVAGLVKPDTSLFENKDSIEFLNSYLSRYSKDAIYPVNIGETGDNETYYEFLREHNSIYMKLSDNNLSSIGEGEQINQVYKSFKVTVEGHFDIHIPISQLLVAPKISFDHMPPPYFVDGSYVSRQANYKGERQIVPLKTFHTPEPKDEYIESLKWKEIYKISFFVVSTVDTVDMRYFLSEEVINYLSNLEDSVFEDSFRIRLHEGMTLVDDDYINWLDRFTFEIYHCEPNAIYTLRILMDKGLVDNVREKGEENVGE